MDRTYKLHVTDDDVVHECINMPRGLCDLAFCGVDIRDMRRKHGPRFDDDNLRVVTDKPVTCIGCLAIFDDERARLLMRYAPVRHHVTQGGTDSFCLDKSAPDVHHALVGMTCYVTQGAGVGQVFVVSNYDGVTRKVTPCRPLVEEVDMSSVVEF